VDTSSADNSAPVPVEVVCLSDGPLDELDLPHIVMCRDQSGMYVSYFGPYPSAVEAMVAAEIEGEIEREAAGGMPVTFHVAALYPAFT
jgi:hypothetical protein